jgi:hypothetical protein
MPPRAKSLSISTDNPFSASRLRPGALEFLFRQGESLEACLARLEQNGGWGQIRRPHGSGKSTLLCALLSRLACTNRHVEHMTLHTFQSRLPVSREEIHSWTSDTQLAIDGFEQLSWWARWRVQRLCRRCGCGLLVTAHQDVGLPDVYVTEPTLELAQRVAARLMEGWPTLIGPQDVERCFLERRGDLRETFFTLYDVFLERSASHPRSDTAP